MAEKKTDNLPYVSTGESWAVIASLVGFFFVIFVDVFGSVLIFLAWGSGTHVPLWAFIPWLAILTFSVVVIIVNKYKQWV